VAAITRNACVAYEFWCTEPSLRSARNRAHNQAPCLLVLSMLSEPFQVRSYVLSECFVAERRVGPKACAPCGSSPCIDFEPCLRLSGGSAFERNCSRFSRKRHGGEPFLPTWRRENATKQRLIKQRLIEHVPIRFDRNMLYSDKSRLLLFLPPLRGEG
jgi:hypothetical protein